MLGQRSALYWHGETGTTSQRDQRTQFLKDQKVKNKDKGNRISELAKIIAPSQKADYKSFSSFFCISFQNAKQYRKYSEISFSGPQSSHVC